MSDVLDLIKLQKMFFQLNIISDINKTHIQKMIKIEQLN